MGRWALTTGIVGLFEKARPRYKPLTKRVPGMRIHFVLPGLHRVQRGAEVAFESVAQELGLLGEDVMLVGTGRERSGRAYRFQHDRLSLETHALGVIAFPQRFSGGCHID